MMTNQRAVILTPFAKLTGDDLQWATERAAIREFDSGQPREEAERKAAYELAYIKAGRELPSNFEVRHT